MLARFLLAALATATLLAGCIDAPEPVDPATSELAEEVVGTIATEVVEGDILLSVATPMRTINNGGAFAHVTSIEENMTGLVVEVEWKATTPASNRLSVWVRPTGVGAITPENAPNLVTSSGAPLAKADGASPLRLVLPADTFPATGDYDIIVRASAAPVGVAIEQPFTLHVTTFRDVAFDDTFSALATEE